MQKKKKEDEMIIIISEEVFTLESNMCCVPTAIDKRFVVQKCRPRVFKHDPENSTAAWIH